MIRRSFVVAACAIAVALAGCTERQVDDAGNAVASAAPKLANDGRILAEVEGRFATIDATSALHVAVGVHDGTVRLRGKVLRDATARRFEAAAKATSGVRGVDAKLVVDGTLPRPGVALRDLALAAAVQTNLAAQSGINALSIRVEARGGMVTLVGAVPSDAVKATMLAAARGTAGVTSVVDRLRVRA